MAIKSTNAFVLELPIKLPVANKEITRQVLFAEVTDDTGVSGYGVSGMMFQRSSAEYINREIGGLLVGENPVETERIWTLLRDELNPYDQTGVWSTAVSAVDIALWDIKGKIFGEPVWRLLGGARNSVKLMVTPGLSNYDKDQLVEVCEKHVSEGVSHLKIQVGRQNPPDLNEDVARVEAVRDAIGDEVSLSIDANEKLSINQARELGRKVEEYDISFFEEPVVGNDPHHLADLRKQIDIPISAGQNEGSWIRHRDFIRNGSVDFVQPNVCYVGGYTAGMKVASLAQANNHLLANGGGKAHHNMHLIGAMPNGWKVEFNPLSSKPTEIMFEDPPTPSGEEMTLGEEPGLGLDPNWDELKRYKV